jgi:hypothetical protein
MSHKLLKRMAQVVIATATVATAAFCVVPLLAVATGAYASPPMGVGFTSRLWLLVLPQAVAVAPAMRRAGPSTVGVSMHLADPENVFK